jgi:hypothetical protein
VPSAFEKISSIAKLVTAADPDALARAMSSAGKAAYVRRIAHSLAHMAHNAVPMKVTSTRAWLGCALALALAAASSIALRQDSSWDLLNYHSYNAWAFVHARFGLDWAPAQLQSFYSPLLDLPFYGLVAADVPPRVIAAWLALPTGIAWFFFAAIVRRLFAPDRAAMAAAVAIGVTAPMAVSLIGTTMNDWFNAAFVMAALWLVVRGDKTPMRRALIAAGALVGAGAGLKLTGAIYAIGLAVAAATIGSTWRERLHNMLATSAATAVAFALTGGPWMALMYARYGNPLFPYYNDIFRSPWADPVSFSATRFGPASLPEWLVFPYELLWKLEHFVSEPEFRDARPALLYTLAIAVLVARVLARSRAPRDPLPHARFLGVFFLASFLAWAVVYRIFRYLVPLELLGGIFIVYLLRELVPRRRLTLALAVAFALVAVTAKFPTWWRQRFEEHFLAVALPPVKPDALVLLVAPEPLSYVLPAFPKDARFAGLVSNFNDPDRRNLLARTIAEAIRSHRGALYALAVPPGGDVAADALAKVGLAREGCSEIHTNLRVSPIELCELRRIR